MSNAAADQRDVPHGSTLLPRDLTEDELAAAPALPSADVLVIEDMTNDEDEAFASALRS
jgi:hypothetical protein